MRGAIRPERDAGRDFKQIASDGQPHKIPLLFRAAVRFVKVLPFHWMGLVVRFTCYDNITYSCSALIFTQSVQAFFVGLYFLMFLAALKRFDVYEVPLPRLLATHLSVARGTQIERERLEGSGRRGAAFCAGTGLQTAQLFV